MGAEARPSGRRGEQRGSSGRGSSAARGQRGGGARSGPERPCAAQGWPGAVQSTGRAFPALSVRGRAPPLPLVMAGPRADPELAKRLFFEGAAVVVLGVPEGTEFGIDCNSWTAGPRFRGVKMVPPGVHFVHCSAARSGGGAETGPRAGRFLCLRPRQVRALRWEPGSEELREAALEEEEALGRDLREMDAFFGPYPYETLKKWISLSGFVGEAAVERLRPESGQISAFSEVLPVRAGRHGRDRAGQKLPPYDAGCGSYAEGMARLPEMRPRAGTEIRFTELPRQTYPDGASPEEITRHSMDLSYALEKVIARRYAGRPQELLGECAAGEPRAELRPCRAVPGAGGRVLPGAPVGSTGPGAVLRRGGAGSTAGLQSELLFFASSVVLYDSFFVGITAHTSAALTPSCVPIPAARGRCLHGPARGMHACRAPAVSVGSAHR